MSTVDILFERVLFKTSVSFKQVLHNRCNKEGSYCFI